MSVQIVIADADAHARLLHAIFAQSYAWQDSCSAKRSIAIIHEQETRSGVGSNVDVLPTILIQIGRHDCHAIGSRSLVNARRLAYIRKCSIAVISIQRMLSRLQPARAAVDGNSFPAAIRILAGDAGAFKSKANVIRNK